MTGHKGACFDYTYQCGSTVKALTCQVEGLGFKSHHRKFGEKTWYPLLAWWKSRWWECSPTHKNAGVCAIMSIWLVHIKEHVDHWNMPNHHTSTWFKLYIVLQVCTFRWMQKQCVVSLGWCTEYSCQVNFMLPRELI